MFIRKIPFRKINWFKCDLPVTAQLTKIIQVNEIILKTIFFFLDCEFYVISQFSTFFSLISLCCTHLQNLILLYIPLCQQFALNWKGFASLLRVQHLGWTSESAAISSDIPKIPNGEWTLNTPLKKFETPSDGWELKLRRYFYLRVVTKVGCVIIKIVEKWKGFLLIQCIFQGISLVITYLYTNSDLK